MPFCVFWAPILIYFIDQFKTQEGQETLAIHSPNDIISDMLSLPGEASHFMIVFL